jgi:hypothetical protein
MVEVMRRAGRPLLDWAVAAEAALWVAVAGVTLRVLSFRRVAGLAAGRPATTRRASQASVAGRIGWAVTAAADRAPWRVRCFERGLAACLMLRRRGQQPVLYYGARNDGSAGPTAHVWVRLGDWDVVGADGAERFAVLARFPPEAGACGADKVG